MPPRMSISSPQRTTPTCAILFERFKFHVDNSEAIVIPCRRPAR